jgi:non-ribosomal peptide synthetase component F
MSHRSSLCVADAVKRGSVVGLVFERSVHWLVSMMAVLKAGAAYVPIDPAYPDDRISYLMKDSGARLLLTQQSVLSGTAGQHAPAAGAAANSTGGGLPAVLARAEHEQKGSLSMFVVDAEWEKVKAFDGNGLGTTRGSSNSLSTLGAATGAGAGAGGALSESKKARGLAQMEKDVRSQVSGNDVVYIVYTSGSTGRPKGCMIRHSALVSMAQWHAVEYKHTPADRGAQMIGPGFDPVGLELWPFWISGASVHIMPDSAR